MVHKMAFKDMESYTDMSNTTEKETQKEKSGKGLVSTVVFLFDFLWLLYILINLLG